LTYLLCLEGVVAGLEGQEFLAVDMDAVRDDMLRTALVCKRVCDDLQFSGWDLVAGQHLTRLGSCAIADYLGVKWFGNGAGEKEGSAYSEAWRGCPDGCTGHIADDGFVDVAGADEATKSDRVSGESIERGK